MLAAVPSGALGSEARAPAAPARMRALRGRRDVPPAALRPPTLGSEIAGRAVEGPARGRRVHRRGWQGGVGGWSSAQAWGWTPMSSA